MVSRQISVMDDCVVIIRSTVADEYYHIHFHPYRRLLGLTKFESVLCRIFIRHYMQL